MFRPKRKVLLIGWDAADWKVISPLLDAGKMPHLESLINRGTMGKLATLTPILSPMLWTSIATGKRPYKHGILGFAEPDPTRGGIRPITNLSRKTKAIWNILSQKGLKSNVIGWWPSHPAEPINGVMVSNHFQRAIGPSGDDWPMMQNTVHPSGLAETLAQFRVHPSEIEGAQILPFVPKAAEIDQKKDRRLTKVLKILAECAGVHACATAVMQNEEWDFMAIYYDAVDHFCHGFMSYHPPRQEHVDEGDFEVYKEVVESAYRFHDLMLGTTLKLAGEDTTVILMSDHGFHPDHLRPKEIPNEPNGPAVEHSHLGIFVASGPGIKKDASVFGANLLDITPTLLSLFGLPVGEDMDGRVLSEIFEESPEVEMIPSWDQVEGADGRHPPHYQSHPEDDREMMRQLVDLGYVEEPGDDKKRSEAKALRELRFNLARSYIDAERHVDSIPILEELVEESPTELRFLNQLAFSNLSADRLGETRRIAERILEIQKETGREYAGEYSALNKELGESAEGEFPPDFDKRREALKRKAAIASAPQHLLWGCLLAAEGESEKALLVLQQIPETSWTTPILPLRIGHVCMVSGDLREARRCFERALEIDPQNARAFQLLMQLSLSEKKYEEAAGLGFSAVGFQYFQPVAHYQIGCALAGLKHYEQAVEAFEVALSQNPGFVEAHEHLAEIYDRFLKNPKKAERHYRFASESVQVRAKKRANRARPSETINDPTDPVISERLEIPGDWKESEIITIVTGLPRAGTSMMMQMLQAGGLDCFSDGLRTPDENNPKGYFELEGIKELHRNASVLDGASGKVVKIVAPIIPRLPEGAAYRFRVVFIERDPDEIFASQAAMLRRLGKPQTKSDPASMKRSYAKLVHQVNEVLENRGIPTIRISYRETVTSPELTARRLKGFFKTSLDEGAMVGSVDAALYRERK